MTRAAAGDSPRFMWTWGHHKTLVPGHQGVTWLLRLHPIKAGGRAVARCRPERASVPTDSFVKLYHSWPVSGHCHDHTHSPGPRGSGGVSK